MTRSIDSSAKTKRGNSLSPVKEKPRKVSVQSNCYATRGTADAAKDIWMNSINPGMKMWLPESLQNLPPFALPKERLNDSSSAKLQETTNKSFMEDLKALYVKVLKGAKQEQMQQLITIKLVFVWLLQPITCSLQDSNTTSYVQ
eukprot:jgi/Psemu1/59157/gm1.59157_g